MEIERKFLVKELPSELVPDSVEVLSSEDSPVPSAHPPSTAIVRSVTKSKLKNFFIDALLLFDNPLTIQLSHPLYHRPGRLQVFFCVHQVTPPGIRK